MAADRAGKVQICAWLTMDQVSEIDKKCAELQVGNPNRVHRSDILKMALDRWIEDERRSRQQKSES